MRTWCPGTAIAAAPAPTQPLGRYEGASGEKDGGAGVVVVVAVVVGDVEVVVGVVVVVVVEVVVGDVVVVVSAAYADAAPRAARTTPIQRNQTPRRIAPVCRTVRLFVEL